MIYTYQEWSESGSFSNPTGTDVHYARSRDELRHAFSEWIYAHHQVGSNYGDAELLVWRGRHADVTDVYPDMIISLGPRDGVRFRPA